MQELSSFPDLGRLAKEPHHALPPSTERKLHATLFSPAGKAKRKGDGAGKKLFYTARGRPYHLRPPDMTRTGNRKEKLKEATAWLFQDVCNTVQYSVVFIADLLSLQEPHRSTSTLTWAFQQQQQQNRAQQRRCLLLWRGVTTAKSSLRITRRSAGSRTISSSTGCCCCCSCCCCCWGCCCCSTLSVSVKLATWPFV